MLALINTPTGAQPIALREIDPPAPAAHEALVGVRATSVNRGELALIASRPEGWRPGQDVAGVVEAAASDGSGPPTGSRVVGLVDGAGWSEHVTVPTDRLAVLAETVSFEQAATLPIAGITALRTLRYGGDLLGRTVLVTGASGGVGRLQVQLAALSGAQVTAVARTEHAEALKATGASDVAADIDATASLFDLITESVGGSSLTAAIAHSRPGGTIVVFGASSGEKTPISLYDFIGHEDLTLQVFMSYASPQPYAPDLQLLADLAATGKLHPYVERAVSWTEAALALAALSERRVHGKIVLTIT
ncbi:MAG: zinc-binding dehydrogenase [Acidimicrobiales bacterium]